MLGALGVAGRRGEKRVDFVVGLGESRGASASVASTSATQQQERLEQLKRGTLRVLVSTDVLAEGTDVPSCACVVRLDPPTSYVNYVQKLGRVRDLDGECVEMRLTGAAEDGEKAKWLAWEAHLSLALTQPASERRRHINDDGSCRH